MTAFLQRYLKKARPEDITYDDFKLFMQQGVEEHQTLEYKPRGILVRQDDTVIRSTNPREIVGFAALAKSVASLANSEGGLLILGVKEEPERYKGEVVKVRPGAIAPVPLSVTREMIEANLIAKIQYPVEGITIVPLRSSTRSKGCVYLIDVPQSLRAPHRVNELYYYQRYNFMTQEMKHYQIADLFGRRLAPVLDIEVQRIWASNEQAGHRRVRVTIVNTGSSVAKYVTCICTITGGPYEIWHARWQVYNDRKSCCYKGGSESVLHPGLPANTGYIDFQAPKGLWVEPLQLRFSLFAEGMPPRSFDVLFDPADLAIEMPAPSKN